MTQYRAGYDPLSIVFHTPNTDVPCNTPLQRSWLNSEKKLITQHA